MDHRLMRYFVAVAEELHFGRAAARLNLAQPPLSAAIKRLETQVGAPLFERTSRRVSLNPAGRAYLPEVRDILEHTERAAEAARRAAQGESAQLSVGYKGGSLNNVLPRAVRGFRTQFPGVELQLQELNVLEVAPALIRGDVQVGLLCPQLGAPELVTETILREPLILALPKGHPLAHLTRVPLGRLAGEPFVGFQRHIQPEVHGAVAALCRSAGFSQRVVQEVATEAAAVGLIAAGMGVGLVSSSQRWGTEGGVEYRFLEGPTVEVELTAAWRREDRTAVTAAFLRQLREAGREVTEAERRLSRALVLST